MSQTNSPHTPIVFPPEKAIGTPTRATGVAPTLPPRPVPIGPLVLKLGRQYHGILAGPYRAKPIGYFGVNVAEEIREDADIWIPTRDFGVPDEAIYYDGMLQLVTHLLSDPRKVYVGCQGGKGRTGMVLAGLAKVAGERDPVEYVRKGYHSRAVETPTQERFVRGFPARRLLLHARWQAKAFF